MGIRGRLRRGLGGVFGVAALAVTGLAGLPADARGPAEGRILAAALEAAAGGDWARAGALAATTGDRVAGDILLWLRLARGEGSWPEYEAFLAAHPDWPNLDRLRAEAERAMPARLAPAEVLRLFAADPPLSWRGALALAAAQRATGRGAEAEATLRAAWTTLPLGAEGLAEFARAAPQLLRKQALARADAMLWAGMTEEAAALLPHLPPGPAALVRARIALQRRERGVDALIAAVPPALADDPGLARDRFEWRMRHGREDDAARLLLERSDSAARLGRPEAWAARRLQLAHRAMRAGDARTAYALAARHQMGAGEDFEQLEWFAGWVALRRLGDPRRALEHFRRFDAAVRTPISRGRAGYWLGRSWEALGDRARALDAYRAAAAWQTSFYGQLAAQRAGLPPDPALAGSTQAVDWRRARFMQRPAGQAALLFHHAGEAGRVWQFLVHLARRETDGAELAAMAQMALELGRTHVAVRIAKIAAGRGMLLMPAYYPLTDLAGHAGGLPPELVLSIARQESEFNPEAISPAGARGLMQLMPATARKMARALGVEYAPERLTSDWLYNATLGRGYLAEQLADFGSVPLMAAAYNAGPNRVRQWLATLGAPGRDADAVIDWIESIPFPETRNYVMRVMEGLHVYRARLTGRAQPLRLLADLGVRG